MGSEQVFEILSTTTTLETYPQLIGYNTDVYSYFKEQEHLCGYDLNLTYPQNGYFPSLNLTLPTERNVSDLLLTRKTRFNKQFFTDAQFTKRSHSRGPSKRDLTGRANGTIDGWYGCFLYDELVDYALNFSFPWTLQPHSGTDFNVYDIPSALSPPAPQDASVFLNDNRTIAAIHAPTSKQWVESIDYPFGNVADGQDPSVEPMAFLTELATNATKHNVSVVIFSGNDDSLVAHRGSEGS
jgi:carboxypeptidase D